MSKVLNIGGGVLPSPVVKAVLDAVGGAYIVDQGKVEQEGPNTKYDTSIYYRIWSNGFLEMWQGLHMADKTVTYPFEFANTDYVLVGVGFTLAGVGAQEFTRETTGFKTNSVMKESTTFAWYACGYKA